MAPPVFESDATLFDDYMPSTDVDSSSFDEFSDSLTEDDYSDSEAKGKGILDDVSTDNLNGKGGQYCFVSDASEAYFCDDFESDSNVVEVQHPNFDNAQGPPETDSTPTKSSLAFVSEVTSTDGNKFWIPESTLKPVIGNVYKTLFEGVEAYKKYAIESGFEVRVYTSRVVKDMVVFKYYVCNKQGTHPKATDCDQNPESINSKNPRKRLSIRTNCPAFVRFHISSKGSYTIDMFEDRHNHAMVHPEDMHFLKSQRKMKFTHRAMVHDLSTYNLGPTKVHHISSRMVGGSSKVGASVEDFKNFKRDILKYIDDADAQVLVQRLHYKKTCVPDFSFDYSCSATGMLSSVFWADDVAKRNYNVFGDIMSFDATFRTNKYNMIFVPFTGIDNHRKCVTFGAGLLSTESQQSYSWLLDAFLRAFGKAPHVVVTDQDPSMKIAIKEVFPTARHRLCMWHIMDKLSIQVGAKICKETNFRKRLLNLVWDELIDPKSFQVGWKSLIKEFSLHKNRWLHKLYKIRRSWIPAFFRNTYMSGLMRTTSRSESENCFFQQLMSPNLTLLELYSHFETAMEFQRSKQRFNDLQSSNKHIELQTKVPFEKQASSIYTLTMFSRVQNEIAASASNCLSVNSSVVDVVTTYVVRDISQASTMSYENQVTITQDNGSVRCTCKLFQRKGYLCSHCFYVLRMSCVTEIPPKYILQRWTKGVVSTINKSTQHSHSVNASESLRDVVRDITNTFDDYLNIFVGDDAVLQTFRNEHNVFLKHFHARFQDKLAPLSTQQTIEKLFDTKKPDEVSIHVPHGIRNKGCGSRKRMVGKTEQARINASKRERLCRYCNKHALHDSRNCPEKNKQ